MTNLRKDLLSEYYKKRQAGMEFTAIRKELEEKGIGGELIKDIIAEINEMELNNLTLNKTTAPRLIATAVSVLLIASGVVLWFWMDSRDLGLTYKTLTIVPIILGVGSYALHRKNSKSLNR